VNTLLKFSGAMVVATLHCHAYAGDVSGIVKAQSAYDFNAHKTQQQEVLLDVEYNQPLFSGDLKAIARFRHDGIGDLNHRSRPQTYSRIGGPLANGEAGTIDLRELYWDGSNTSTFWRLGKQQVVWGEADGLKLLDVINPQNFREFILDDFDDSRIPLWMANVEYTVGDNSLIQILWIPDTTTHELAPAHSPFAFTSRALVPQQTPGQKVFVEEASAPDSLLKDSDVGIRFTQFTGGWDVSLNYLYHYVDTPVVRVEVSDQLLRVSQEYERSQLIGGTASTVVGDWTVRAEIAYETDRYHRTVSTAPGVTKAGQWSTVLGLDWQGWTDQFISVQWFQTTVVGSGEDLINNQSEDTATFLWESKFMNETVTLKWLHIFSLDHGDGVLQTKLTYNYRENIDIYAGVDVFYGDREGLFGQFKEADRFRIGFEWGF
jgi:hypothetical protein